MTDREKSDESNSRAGPSTSLDRDLKHADESERVPYAVQMHLDGYSDTVLYALKRYSKQCRTLHGCICLKDTPPERPAPEVIQVDKTPRRLKIQFIREVYAILLFQYLFTTGVIALFDFVPYLNALAKQNVVLLLSALWLFIVVLTSLLLCRNLIKQLPVALLQISMSTITQSWFLGVISGFFGTRTLLFSAAICASACFAISLFSFSAKFELLNCIEVTAILALCQTSTMLLMTFQDMMDALLSPFMSTVAISLLIFGTHVLLQTEDFLYPESIPSALYLYMQIILLYRYVAFCVKKR